MGLHRNQEELIRISDIDSKQFWRKIGKNGIGNQRQLNISNVVTLDDGSITDNSDIVLNKWKFIFQTLLNLSVDSNSDRIDNYSIKENIVCNEFDDEITINEVYKTVMGATNGKSLGIDLIQAEVYTNQMVIYVLHKLFNLCFKTSKVPSMWNREIITPIPKCSTSDPRDLLSHRGIALAPFAYKVSCGILNDRLVQWLDEREIIQDEQKGRSTVDHINTITSIIETRKKCKLSTYVVFIDFKKAHDSINRALLFNKIENVGISSKFKFALKRLYSNIECSVRLNGNMTDWFNVDSGLKQGCILSSVMFNIYVNSLIDDINALNIGIDIDNEKLAML